MRGPSLESLNQGHALSHGAESPLSGKRPRYYSGLEDPLHHDHAAELQLQLELKMESLFKQQTEVRALCVFVCVCACVYASVCWGALYAAYRAPGGLLSCAWAWVCCVCAWIRRAHVHRDRDAHVQPSTLIPHTHAHEEQALKYVCMCYSHLNDATEDDARAFWRSNLATAQAQLAHVQQRIPSQAAGAAAQQRPQPPQQPPQSSHASLFERCDAPSSNNP